MLVQKAIIQRFSRITYHLITTQIWVIPLTYHFAYQQLSKLQSKEATWSQIMTRSPWKCNLHAKWGRGYFIRCHIDRRELKKLKEFSIFCSINVVFKMSTSVCSRCRSMVAANDEWQSELLKRNLGNDPWAAIFWRFYVLWTIFLVSIITNIISLSMILLPSYSQATNASLLAMFTQRSRICYLMCQIVAWICIYVHFCDR